MSATILVVEDEQSLVEALEYRLRREGYEVLTATDGVTGLRLARERRPDVVVLDVMLPGMDGLEVCRRLRNETAVPILMLTARAEEIDKVVGLEIGADDYMTKPFGMRELLARVKAMLRRASLNAAAREQDGFTDQDAPQRRRLVFGNLILNVDRHEVLLDGLPLPLTPKEYDLLMYLAQHRGMVMSRDQVLENVWGWSYGGGTRTVDVHVRWLREKIEPNPGKPERIVTVRGAGYRFEG